MTEVQFRPQGADLVVASHAEFGSSIALNYVGHYADGSEVRALGVPDDVTHMVCLSAKGTGAAPDQGTVGKLWAPGPGVFAFDVQLERDAFEAVLRSFQAGLLPTIIQMEVLGLEMPASGGFQWNDVGQPMPIAGAQLFVHLAA